ncbi:MAG: hypothetical protein WCK02_02195 [Bacteroidota bacterium]
MKKFKCNNCDMIFDSEGEKQEYNNAIYGPCARYVAKCPECNNEVGEYIEPKLGKTNSTASNPCNGCCACH